ncbi:MAG: hydrogenase expression/formation C-terminal domain-containing protein [Pseudomonadota bacterium]|nr:hydrogenase expression/formation C-terminal domain-containing protein [Pseudomonadota bacterium]
MNSMDSSLKVEIGSYNSGNIPPLLHEIRHALRNLLDNGETTTIDLRGLPMAPGEQQQLLDILGKGEISVYLDALGKSEITESIYAGVWLIIHYNSNGEVMGKFIEITRMPAILKAQTADMKGSLAALQKMLEEL